MSAGQADRFDARESQNRRRVPAALSARVGEEGGGRGAVPSGEARRSVSAVERRVGVLDVEAGVDADLDSGRIEDRKADQDGKDEKQELHRNRGLVSQRGRRNLI